MSKLKEYCDEQIKIQCLLHPDVDPKKIEEIVKNIINERNKQKEKTSFSISFPDDDKPDITNVSLTTLEKKLEKEKPILTKYGTVFKRQEQEESILAQMLSYLADLRKGVKKEMLTHVNDEDQTIYEQLDIQQKTIKILMNSFKIGGFITVM